MLGKRKHAAGLYIGTKKTVLAKLQKVGTNQFIVEHLSATETPLDTFDEEGVVNVPSLSRVIRDLMSESDIRSQDISLAISTKNGVIIRTLPLPSMSKKELREALGGEVENYAPLSSDEPVLDFQIIGQTFEGATQKLELLLVAAPKSLIRSYIASVESAGLKAFSIEPLPLAILRTISPQTEEIEDENISVSESGSVMSVYLEENDGIVTISRDQSIRFIHGIDFGRSHLDNARVFGELAGEIRSSLTFYQSAFPEYKVDKIYLYVDGEDSESICSRLSEFLDIPVTTPPVPETSDDDTSLILKSNMLSAYAAIGTAMFTKGEGVINLIPSKSSIGSIDIKKQAFMGALSVLLAILLSIGITFGLKAWTRSIIQKTQSTREYREGYREGIVISGAETEVVKLRSQIEMAKRTLDKVSLVKWVEALPELRSIIPKNIWLSSLSWQENNNAILNGYSLSYDSVFRFMDTIKTSPYFSYPQMTFVRRMQVGEKSYMQFEIRCGIKVDKMSREEVGTGGIS